MGVILRSDAVKEISDSQDCVQGARKENLNHLMNTFLKL